MVTGMRARCCLGSLSAQSLPRAASMCTPARVHSASAQPLLPPPPGWAWGEAGRLQGSASKKYSSLGQRRRKETSGRGQTCERGALQEQPSDHCRPESHPLPPASTSRENRNFSLKNTAAQWTFCYPQRQLELAKPRVFPDVVNKNLTALCGIPKRNRIGEECSDVSACTQGPAGLLLTPMSQQVLPSSCQPCAVPRVWCGHALGFSWHTAVLTSQDLLQWEMIIISSKSQSASRHPRHLRLAGGEHLHNSLSPHLLLTPLMQI